MNHHCATFAGLYQKENCPRLPLTGPEIKLRINDIHICVLLQYLTWLILLPQENIFFFSSMSKRLITVSKSHPDGMRSYGSKITLHVS